MTKTTDEYNAGGSLFDLALAIWREGHVTDQQLAAVRDLVQDMRRCHGTSAGLTQTFERQAFSAIVGSYDARSSGDVDAFRRMDRALSKLRLHERELLCFLVLSRELDRGSLVDWGRRRSQYQTPKTQRAFAIGQAVSLFSSIGESYAPAS